MGPQKLRDDAIVEAVCLIHFTASSEVSEVLLGKLSDFGSRGEFTTARLPIADMPAAVRRAAPQFEYQPLLELQSRAGRIMRVGDNVLSWHVVGVGAYPGWIAFRDEWARVIGHLFNKVQSPAITNASLRYINALVPSRHKLAGVQELNLQVQIAGEVLRGDLNLNFAEPTSTHVVTTRIADTAFVAGNLPIGTTAVVDVEVSAAPGMRVTKQEDVPAWFDEAHAREKRAFFRLIPAPVLKQLTEE